MATKQHQHLLLAIVHHFHHHPHPLLLNLLFLSVISQGQKRCRPTVQLGLSELPKENHSAPFFLLHFLALSSFRGDTHSAVYLSVCPSLSYKFSAKLWRVPLLHYFSFSSPQSVFSNYVCYTSDLFSTVYSVNESEILHFPKWPYSSGCIFYFFMRGYCVSLSEEQLVFVLKGMLLRWDDL